jgi:hypothetical protein
MGPPGAGGSPSARERTTDAGVIAEILESVSKGVIVAKSSTHFRPCLYWSIGRPQTGCRNHSKGSGEGDQRREREANSLVSSSSCATRSSSGATVGFRIKAAKRPRFFRMGQMLATARRNPKRPAAILRRFCSAQSFCPCRSPHTLRLADCDEAGHAFQSEVPPVPIRSRPGFRSDVGHTWQ